MAQEYMLITEPAPATEELHEALTRCKSCNHIVPKTMGCLYCGAPILYKPPAEE
ncbi:MAG: hypothetical protein NWF07_01505 [Candidatus Bathyarchaeota archaeon]|nr:hypothetical protein [Candidatus Bathyarchaeota archaeon]